MEELPVLTSSPALQEIKTLFEHIKSDEIVVANKSRGHVAARTRLRVALAKLSKLCVQARKEIPPKG